MWGLNGSNGLVCYGSGLTLCHGWLVIVLVVLFRFGLALIRYGKSKFSLLGLRPVLLSVIHGYYVGF